jgi:hypothetical protein
LWQTESIVLIEVWEHLRGYSNWTPTKATVESSTPSGIEFGRNAAKQSVAWQSVCKIAWLDQNRIPHTAEFEAFEESPLYQLCDGDTVEIRFNPKKPDQFYLPGLIQSRLAKAWKLTIFAVMLILAMIGIAIAWFGPHILNAISR